jgi:2,4-dienoyl-CoA reductase-like NADH-dependent reductase (Old Yellow Enzyme family)
MCQYSAEEGAANDWHLQHLARSRCQQMAVEPAGRFSRGCLGLYSDADERALARVVDFCRRAGSTALGIELAHAGRKGNDQRTIARTLLPSIIIPGFGRGARVRKDGPALCRNSSAAAG